MHEIFFTHVGQCYITLNFGKGGGEVKFPGELLDIIEFLLPNFLGKPWMGGGRSPWWVNFQKGEGRLRGGEYLPMHTYGGAPGG